MRPGLAHDRAEFHGEPADPVLKVSLRLVAYWYATHFVKGKVKFQCRPLRRMGGKEI